VDFKECVTADSSGTSIPNSPRATSARASSARKRARCAFGAPRPLKRANVDALRVPAATRDQIPSRETLDKDNDDARARRSRRKYRPDIEINALKGGNLRDRSLARSLARACTRENATSGEQAAFERG